ncbi:MAG: hypothetical protein LBR22_08010 [Desulfovibrio sp.]|nr:hypothetical protein [Desulfovibrio sp.]
MTTEYKKNSLEFNISGPCRPGKHYMIDPLARLPIAKRLCLTEKYFVIHAPRQSGKTTTLEALVDEINGNGQHYAIYCSLEEVVSGVDMTACTY